MNFAQTLRDAPRSLPNPVNFGFDHEVWHAAFIAQRDGTPADDHVYMLGCVLAGQTDRIRRSVDALHAGLRFRQVEELSRSFARKINETQVLVFNSIHKSLEGVSAIPSEQLREIRCFTDSAGNHHSIQVPMEAVVDAMGMALKLLQHTNGIGRLDAHEAEAAIEPALHHLMNLAQHSLSIHRVWNSVLWFRSSVHVSHDQKSYFIDERNSALAYRATIDLTRRPALLERAMSKMKAHDTQDDMVMVPKVIQRNGALTVEAIPAFLISPEERKALLKARHVHGILQDATLTEFLHEIHPEVGLPIGEMLHIWGELAIIAGQLHSLAQPLDSSQSIPERLSLLESSLPKNALVAAIERCVVLSHPRVTECLEFLCFTSKRETSLWEKPLLAAGEQIALLWWPLIGSHQARILCAWSKQHPKLKRKFGTKGKANERILVEAFKNAALGSPFRDRLRLIGTSLNPRGKPDEEIDLLLVVDDTAFVIETGSIPYPADAYEFHETEIRLDEKAAQCRNQCAALSRDLNQIAEWAEDEELIGQVKKVVGILITNSFLRDGLYDSDICFVHWDTFINAIYGGTHFGLLRDQEEVTLKAPVQLAPNRTTAEGLIAYLRRPPKAEFYSRCVVPITYNVKGFDHTDVEGFYLAHRIDFPSYEQLENKLRGCSFGRTLIEVPDPT